jgi:hypothetical protein
MAYRLLVDLRPIKPIIERPLSYSIKEKREERTLIEAE